jgi:trans-2-enoyl-CoA reductase
MLETLSKLVNADKLRIDFTEYELCDEFKEAMDHAQARARTP